MKSPPLQRSRRILRMAATEDKVGAQIPANFITFIRGVWFKNALYQAAKKIPVGTDAQPSVYIELRPGEAYLVTKLKGSLR